MKFILAWIRIILCCIALAFGLLHLTIADKLGLHSELHGFKVRRNFIRVVRFILGVKIEKHGTPHDQPALYVSNHRTLSDPLMMCDDIFAYVIAKAEVKKYPLLGKGASLTGCVFVKRDDKDSRGAVKETIRDILRHGKNVLIYPEGTVTVNKFSGHFKKGSMEVAMDLGVPIVPITVEYKNIQDYWRQDGLLKQFIQQFGKWRSHVYVRYHAPFETANMNSALRRVQIEIDGDIARYHGYDDHSPH